MMPRSSIFPLTSLGCAREVADDAAVLLRALDGCRVQAVAGLESVEGLVNLSEVGSMHAEQRARWIGVQHTSRHYPKQFQVGYMWIFSY